MIQFYRKPLASSGMNRIPNIEAPSLQDVFTNLEFYLTELKKLGDLNNIYYTINDTEGDRGKDSFKRATHFAFDIDNGIDSSRVQDYAACVKEVLGCADENMTVISSGHGLHFILPLTDNQQWSDTKLLLKKRLQYRKICSSLQGRLEEHKLSGKVDSSIFDTARVLRVPGTINLKPNREPVKAEMLSLGITPFDLDMESISGIPDSDPTSDSNPTPAPRKDTSSIQWFGDNDDEFIIENCEAIKFAKCKPGSVDEPLWYAIDSVVGKLQGGRERIHQWSKGHPSYDQAAVDKKIDQALAASGPRTCAHIEGLWDGCSGCRFYKKVTSPIQLKGPDFISTQSTGFHTISATTTGGVKRTPCFEDMLKQFKKEHGSYVAHARSIYTWTGTHYTIMPDDILESFAFTRFVPTASKLGDEFRKQACMSKEIRPIEWFRETTEHRLNLTNGVYNLKTGILSPHDTKFGFKSVLNFAWDPEATCPEFDKFLQAVTCGDAELERALLEYMAYAIAGGRCSAELILVLTGEGANGKTTFLRILRAIFGTSMVTMKPKDFSDKFGPIRLYGALACVIEETPSYRDRDFWEMMKNVSSGGQLQGEEKFKPAFEFENRAKIIMTCNVMPGGTDASHGFYRRLLPIPFNATFSDATKDEGIGDRIIANELPGVLNRLLSVYKALDAGAFKISQPNAATEARQAYMLDHDNVLAWVTENFRPCAVAEVPVRPWPNQNEYPWLAFSDNKDGVPLVLKDVAYQAYAESCDKNREKNIASFAHFWRRVLAIYKNEKTIHASQRTIGGKRTYTLVGIMPAKVAPVVR